MFSQTFLTQLYRHMEWADAMVWQAVPVDTVPDQRLRAPLVDYIAWLWLGRPEAQWKS